MREIKFRAWDGKSIRYDITGFEHGKTNEMAGVFLDGDYFAITDDLKKCDAFNPCAIVMEYTGLKDKNGKEIYEGDIITSENYPFTNDGNKNYAGEVYFDDEQACFCLDVIPISDRVRGAAVGGMLCEYAEAAEVIGNIYENPELLAESSDDK